jgi:hypothetical protein
MKTFCLLITVLFGVNVYSQNLLTIGEVFDYDIGDEFHYRDWSEPLEADFEYNYQKVKIIDKVKYDMDSVVYNQIVTNYKLPFGYDFNPEDLYITNIDTQNIQFAHLDSSLSHYDYLYKMDTTKSEDLMEIYLKDTVFQSVDYLCGKWINGIEYLISWGEYDHFTRYYGEGLGLVYSSLHYAEDGKGYLLREMNYYKKGQEVCGNAYIPLSIQNIETNFKIYPNPVQNELIIQLNTKGEKIECNLFDIIGKNVKSWKLYSANNFFDVSDLKVGSYILILKTNEFVISEMIIKQ